MGGWRERERERERERGAAGLGLGGVEHWCGLLGSDGHVAVVVDCWQSVLASVIATGAGLGDRKSVV